MMEAELKKPLKGDNQLGALICAGDDCAIRRRPRTMIGVLTDAKRDYKVRISAAESLNFAGDPAALPTLLQVAKTGDVVKDKEKYPDVRLAAAMIVRAPRRRGGGGGVRAGGGRREGRARGVQGRRRAPRGRQEVRQGPHLLRDGARLGSEADAPGEGGVHAGAHGQAGAAGAAQEAVDARADRAPGGAVRHRQDRRQVVGRRDSRRSTRRSTSIAPSRRCAPLVEEMRAVRAEINSKS